MGGGGSDDSFLVFLFVSFLGGGRVRESGEVCG
jgi:hypothetical protein